MEARGEPIESQIAVAAVTLNRANMKENKGNICKAVRSRDQFSWLKTKYKVNDSIAFSKAKVISELYLEGRLKNPINNRIYFNHRNLGKRYNTPYKSITIKNLVFY